MLPILFKIGPIPIHTYGTMIALGVLVAFSVIKHLSKKANLDVDKVQDLTFFTLIVGFIGARLLYVLTQFDVFVNDPLQVFKVWNGGLVFLGGPIAAVPFFIWYARKHKLTAWAVMDCLIPGLAIAHSFGRVGCIGAGCCYGRPTNAEWGFKFHSDLVDRSLHDIYLHPVQAYESAAVFILFVGLLWVFKHKKFDGQVGLTYFMVYPIIRSITETFRGDYIRGFVIDGLLSTSQFISLLVFLIAGGVLIYRLNTLKKGHS